MKTFQRIQRYISIIPYFSTFFIWITTIVIFKKYKAKSKTWVMFLLMFFGAGLFVTVIGNAFQQWTTLAVIISALILAVSNFFYVDLQKQCTGVETNTNEQHEQRAKKKTQKNVLWTVLLCILLTVGIAKVSYEIKINLDIHKEQTIKDTNGQEDFSLNSITRKEIYETFNNCTMKSFGTATEGNSTDTEDRMLQKIDYDYVSKHAKEFSGITTIHATKTDMNQMTLSITSNVIEGNFVVVIMVDDMYYTDVEINKSAEITLTDIQNKTVLVRIAGESASYKIQIERVMQKAID